MRKAHDAYFGTVMYKPAKKIILEIKTHLKIEYTILLVLIVLGLSSCNSPKKPDPKLIPLILNEKASLSLTKPYEIIKHNVTHTENTIDLDYTWDFELLIDSTEMIKIETEIRKSQFYNPPIELFNAIQDSLTHYKLKGYWVKENELYHFSSPNYETNEQTDIKLNIKTNTLNFNMIHI